MTLLVAGFAAFPGAPDNPTRTLMADLASDRLGGKVSTIVLPVEWEGSWRCLLSAIDDLRPDAVLLFGLHAGAKRIRIELTGRNAIEAGRPDAVGREAAGPVEKSGPETVETRLPLAAMMAGLRGAGVPFELSRDAGRYLCNDTLYRLCRHASAAGIRAYGFVHVPLTDEAALVAAEAGALPTLCRTIPAAVLLRAATVLCQTMMGEAMIGEARREGWGEDAQAAPGGTAADAAVADSLRREML